MIATKERKRRKDTTFFLCDLCVLWRQKFAQKEKAFGDRTKRRQSESRESWKTAMFRKPKGLACSMQPHCGTRLVRSHPAISPRWHDCLHALLRSVILLGVISCLPWLEAEQQHVCGAVIPVFSNGGGKPSAIVRVGAIHNGFQRRAFFRIGVLPAVVAEDVEIELLEAPGMDGLLSRLRAGLPGMRSTDALEMKRFSIRFSGETEPRLKAKEAHIDSDGSLRLSGCTILDASGQWQSIGSGKLNCDLVSGRTKMILPDGSTVPNFLNP